MHSKSNCPTFKKVLIGLMAGITSGTFLGFRLTSDKSIETRKMILNKGEHYLDETGSRFQGILSKLINRVKRIGKRPHRIYHYSKRTEKHT